MGKFGELLLNFVLRGIMGMLLIYFLNSLSFSWMEGIHIGYNWLTFVLSGALGLPGVVLMYGINFYMLL